MSIDWNALPDNPFGSMVSADYVRDTLQSTKGWEATYRQLLLWSKKLPPLPESCRIDQYRVKGCESKVWVVSKVEGGVFQLWADSDSRIVKGLLCMIMALVNEQPKEQVAEADCRAFLLQIGLEKHLSPSRVNGINAVIEYIEGRV